MSKSGLISVLSRADGYIRIPRDAEGLAKGASVEVHLF
jgi:molybdopterin biosynthesis enzyme